jgi:ubiquitin C-terminal hydrolase
VENQNVGDGSQIERFVMLNIGLKKVASKVEFPRIADLEPYVQGPQKKDPELKYVLFASIHHSGTMAGGHYTASILETEEKWWTFNDESVYAKPPDETSADTAYVLLYRRMDPPMPAASQVQSQPSDGSQS